MANQKLIDLRAELSYKATTKPSIVDIPDMSFVMVDGKGAPEGDAKGNNDFQQAVQVLYGIIYTIKFWSKKYPIPTGYAKFSLPLLEGLWWMKNGGEFDASHPLDWRWTVMIRVPDFVTPRFFKQVISELASRKQTEMFNKARLQRLKEGSAVQIMHLGPYNQEAPAIASMHNYARQAGYELTGKHHELYFGDPRRTIPAKLKAVLRRPVKKVGPNAEEMLNV